MASPPFEIYFTGRDDPRDCIIIGEDMQPVFFEFETQCLSPSTVRTTISSNRNPVAAFDWGANGASLGVATIGNREIPMAQLVQPGSPGARRFTSADGNLYEWRRCHSDPRSYELFAAPNMKIAFFRWFSQQTPIGPSHGTLEYSFSHDLLLLEALLALNLNRWLDWTA
ncbi:hypothetical protein K503DRAFT_104550 [Rhizopogon vinicolor AM-OR11-026]|uniref:DUF6593 domain-containing protein n=1 Tax=Rhizopogon vinicolor AM-OR11-026 TaxID=1314800 RepID=A0A1B7N2X2_9AGAM|nr:hypothetical protein K503DRAFT_104550 [Rhizopogon vinicolor AM-OR11-026]